MRVTRSDSKATLLTRLRELWNKLDPALSADDFIEWDLADIRKRFVEEREHNKKLYLTGGLSLTDTSSGTASFHPSTDEEAADDAQERKAAINAYVEAGCSCEHIVVTFVPASSSGALIDELRVIVGARYGHEIVIQAQTSSQAVDYVTNQLRHFGRR
jgi:hypothetical protein